MSSRFRLSCAALWAVTAFATIGCVDPQKTFDEFGERVVDGSVTDATGGLGFFPINGEFLLSIQTSLGQPLRLIAIGSTTPTDDGGGTAEFSFQPIAAENCAKGMGGQPVGEALALPPVTVTPTGTFDVTSKAATVPGDANPITCSDILADIQIIGRTVSEELFCGDVAGMVMEPIPLDLAGSTFGAAQLPEPGVYGDANLPPGVTVCPAGSGDEPDAAP